MSHLFLALLILLSFGACSGNPLLVSPDADVGELNTLHIQSIQYGSADLDGHYPDYLQTDGSKVFVNDAGITITLNQARIHWSHFHLISEGNDPECEAGHNFEIDIDGWQDLMNDDLTPLDLITASIPDRSFCHYEIHFSAEDNTTVGVSGSWDNGVDAGVFDLSVEEEIEIENSFKSGSQDNEHALHYHAGQTEKALIFGPRYDRWFDQITFDADPAIMKAQLKTNVEESFEQYLGEITHGH